MHVVDTNVISELMRPRASAKVVATVSRLEKPALSVITIDVARAAGYPNAAVASP